MDKAGQTLLTDTGREKKTMSNKTLCSLSSVLHALLQEQEIVERGPSTHSALALSACLILPFKITYEIKKLISSTNHDSCFIFILFLSIWIYIKTSIIIFQCKPNVYNLFFYPFLALIFRSHKCGS